MFDHLYLIVSGAGTARRIPGLAAMLATLGPRIIVVSTPNAERVIAPYDIALALRPWPRHRVVESYFDDAIVPRPPRGVVLFAPCTFGSLNKVAAGIADNLAISIVSEAVGRRTPVIVAVSVNVPLWAHPRAKESVATLLGWGVTVLEPVPNGDEITMADDRAILESVTAALAES